NMINLDCCSATCQSTADGTSCSDGNLCTTDDTCRQGTCVGGPPLPCEPCGTCDPASGCQTSLPFSCKTPTATDKALLRLENGPTGHRDALRWQWRSGAATDKVEFGDPRATTGYALCIYGDPSTGAPVMLRAAAQAGCSRRTGCWRTTAKGFDYHSS